MNFIDSDGSIIVPKAVRPIIDFPESHLGTKKGASKQYRSGRLHIREYDDVYTVHLDKLNPEESPIGHLLVDAPEYAVGLTVGLAVGQRVGSKVYELQRKAGKSDRDSALSAFTVGCFAAALAGKVAHSTTTGIKKGCC